jgi:hypothetical protein
MRPAIRSHFPSRAVAPLLSYFDLSYDVWEAGRPSNRVRVLEVNPHRAITAASIALGVSAEKLRALPVASVSIVEAHSDLRSSRLC